MRVIKYAVLIQFYKTKFKDVWIQNRGGVWKVFFCYLDIFIFLIGSLSSFLSLLYNSKLFLALIMYIIRSSGYRTCISQKHLQKKTWSPLEYQVQLRSMANAFSKSQSHGIQLQCLFLNSIYLDFEISFWEPGTRISDAVSSITRYTLIKIEGYELCLRTLLCQNRVIR